VLVFGFSAGHIGVLVPNDYVARYVATDPTRLIGYASVDPVDPGALDELDRSVRDLGLKGLKLAPAYQNCHPLDDRLMAIYERAQQHELPVTVHMGTTPHPSAPLEFGRPVHVDEIARCFPNLPLVMAHVAHPWEPEALVVVRKHPHVYADVSALVYRPLQLHHALHLAQEYAVTEKLLLGSDFPWMTTAGTIDGLRRLATEVPHSDFLLDGQLIEELITRDTLDLLRLSDPRRAAPDQEGDAR
jgi:predicted TIM-barrel fold metal-dependent hydrolase